MKVIIINGQEICISAAHERALRIIAKSKDYVAKLSAFEEGSGNFRRSCLPGKVLRGRDDAALGLRPTWSEYSKREPRVSAFFEANPRCVFAIVGNKRRVNLILKKLDAT